MMKQAKYALCFALGALVLTATPVIAHGPIPTKATEAETTKFQADRANILAMAGTFKVKFDFQEQTAWQPDYTPIAAKVSGGHEVVRVIEDTGRSIMLQHILVAEVEGKTMLVKHWRQDWVYEPTNTLVYDGPNHWRLEAVPEKMQHGRWSQTVWQTDDSPRYAGVGEWSAEGGIPRWRSGWTWRPLARRDAVRHPVYDRYMSINRHSPTPTGWIHWQDNIKMGLKDGKLVPFVQEMTLNTYTRFDGFKAEAADAYWAKTKDYWVAVRMAWAVIILRDKGITVPELAETGSTSGARLMGYADEVNEGKLKPAAAVAKAKLVIAEVTAK